MVCCCLKQNKKCTSECDCVGCKNKGGPPPPSDSSSSCSSSSSPPTSGIVTGKCQAVTQKGTPCKFQAKYGRYCGTHRPPSPSSSSSSSSSSGKQSVENICKQLNYEEVHCLAKKGDLVIWLSSVVHRGSKNTSNKSRSVFYFSLLSSKGNRPNGSTYSLIKNYKKLYVKDF